MMPSSEAIWGKIYPGIDFDRQRLNHLNSYLGQLINCFLIQEELEKDSNYKKCLLLRAMRSRNFSGEFDKVARKLEKELEQTPNKGEHHHFLNYQLHEEQYQKQVLFSKNVQHELQAASDSMDLWYITNKLRHACNAHAHQKVMKADYQFYLVEAVLQEVEDRELTNFPAIAVYYHCFMAMKNTSDKEFDLLLHALQTFEKCFALEELKGMYRLAINFCIRQLNTGHQSYLNKVFLLYKSGLNNHCLLEAGALTPWTYKNIASAGTKLKEYEWVEEFVEQYKTRINHEHATSFYAFSKAHLELNRKAFKAAIRALQQAEIKDLFTLLGAQVIRIKAYYELGDIDLLGYALDNFGKLLKRKDVLTYHKENYSNFIRLTRAISNSKQANTERMRHNIEQATILTEKEWLLEILERSDAE